MSGLANFTYNTIINTVATWVDNNAYNLSRFSSLPAAFKSGYSYTINIPKTQGGNDTYQPTCTVTNSNYFTQTNTSTVISQLQQFFNARGVTNLNANVPTSEFLNFINNLVSFWSTKLVFTVSQFASGQYLIYQPNNTTYNSIVQMTTNEANKLIEASDMMKMFDMLFNIISQNIRSVPIKHNFSFS